MDRSSHIWFWPGFWMVAGFLVLMPLTVDAETVLAPTPPPVKATVINTAEYYPESRFGKPAPDVKRGIETGFMSQEVAEVDESLPGGGDRAPASVRTTSVMGSDPNTAALIGKRGGVQEIALIAGDLGYFPKTFFVTRDIPVRLFVTGASRHSLCLMMDSFHVSKQVRSQKIEEVSFTPTAPGKYRFYCPINGMEGTMIVKEFASSGPLGGEE